MNLFYGAVVAAAALVTSWYITGRFRAYALARGLLDLPNERSSHVIPTPRGGGVAIVLTVLAALPILGALQLAGWRVAYGLMWAGAITALVGFADDRGYSWLLPRLGGHFAAAWCVLSFIGVASIETVLGLPSQLHWVATTLGLLYLVWMLNLTNFMDGIDGLASLEVVTVCVGGIACTLAARVAMDNAFMSEAIVLPLVLAAGTAGFLIWNWPPARIFMGDAGSGFLGILLGALSLVAGLALPELLWSWVILFGAFTVDATVTLVRRVAQRQSFYKAHRTHAYQYAAQRWGHRRVTVSVGLINMCWLLPLALLVAVGRLNGAVALAIAYAPLVGLALWQKAGRPL